APFSACATTSNIHVEKVVNPPSTPVASANRTSGSTDGRCSSTPTSSPSTSAPLTFTVKVAQAFVPASGASQLDTPYLAAAPSAPPSATTRTAVTLRCH